MEKIRQQMGEARSQNAIPHGILLTGRSAATLHSDAESLAALILGRSVENGTEDFFRIQPRNRTRQIGVEEIRELLQVLMKTARNEYKVVLIEDADRLHRVAANALLKTLEEPPPKTIFLLISTKPYGILPTIRSRCQFFRLPATVIIPEENTDWKCWRGAFQNWFCDLLQQKTPQLYLQLYGLLAHFQALLQSLPVKDVTEEKEEIRSALQESQRRGFREEKLADCLRTVWKISLENLPKNGDKRRQEIQRLARRLEIFHETVRLLALNYNETAALEFCFLGLAGIK